MVFPSMHQIDLGTYSYGQIIWLFKVLLSWWFKFVEDLGDYNEMIIDEAHICTQLVSLPTLKQSVGSWWTSHQEFPMVLSS